MPDLSPSAQRVQTALNEIGLTLSVVEFDASTRTAQDTVFKLAPADLQKLAPGRVVAVKA